MRRAGARWILQQFFAAAREGKPKQADDTGLFIQFGLQCVPIVSTVAGSR
jgi:hypothetical protein